jgi:hypothetical protein
MIDRTNIALAKANGMAETLGPSSNGYNVALFIFFPFYALIELPANVMFPRVGVANLLAGILLSSGILSMS